MKNSIKLFFLAMIISVFVLIYKTATKNNPVDVPLMKGTPPAVGNKDNPYARKDWETMRLIDPATGRVPDNMRAKELSFVKNIADAHYYFKAVDFEWTAMGPYNAGGRTRAVAIDITNENTLFAGGVSGGLWRSTNGGNSWSKITTPEQNHSVTCIAQDTRAGKTNIWYYGSGEGAGNSASGAGSYYFGNGLYKSIDSGLTWVALPSTVSGTPHVYDNLWDIIWRVVVSPVDTQDVIYVATIGAIFKSSDGGNTWLKVRGGSVDDFAFYTDVAITSKGVLYATLSSDGYDKGIWRSTDGNNWVNITAVEFPNNFNRIVIGITPTNENEVYFLANTPGNGQKTVYFGSTDWNSLWKYTYLSGDGGGAGGYWKDLSDNLPSKNAEYDNFNTQGSYDMVIKVHPFYSNTVFIGGTNLFRSTDGFTTPDNIVRVGGWLDSTKNPNYEFYPNHFVDQHDIVFSPSNSDILLSVNDAGIFKTENCRDEKVVWQTLNNGYITTQFYTIAIDHGSNKSNVIIGGLQDIGNWFTNSSNPTKAWTNSTVGDGSYCAITDGGKYVYFSRELAQIVKTTLDEHGVPIAYTRIDPIGASDYIFINPFVLDPVDNNIMYLAEGNKLWRNNDLSDIQLDNEFKKIATNWYKFTDTLPVKNSIVSSLAVSTYPSHRLYYGTSNRKIYKIDEAHIGNSTPIEITSNLFPPGAYMNCIAVNPIDADKVMVVFSNYNVYSLFYTSNGGAAWEKVAGNLEQFNNGQGNGPSCRWAVILPDDSGTTYFVATSTGLYATDTLMGLSTVWVQQGSNTIGNVVVDMIDARSSDKFIAVATHGNGVYAANMPDNPTIKVTDLQLNIAPNPANEYTTIKWDIPSKASVKINVYDNLGREVTTLIDQVMGAGSYSTAFSLQELFSGMYYVVLNTNEKKIVSKLVVE